jgi:hypothetical protein
LNRPLLLGCVGLLSVLFVLAGTSKTPVMDGVDHSHTQVLITITDGTFNPPTMLIDEGTLVMLKNNSAEPHWPALSMPLFHDMRPVEQLPPGAAWVIRPMVVGTWELTDIVSPHNTGQITVRRTQSGSSSVVRDSPKIPTGVTFADRLLDPLQSLVVLGRS